MEKTEKDKFHRPLRALILELVIPQVAAEIAYENKKSKTTVELRRVDIERFLNITADDACFGVADKDERKKCSDNFKKGQAYFQKYLDTERRFGEPKVLFTEYKKLLHDPYTGEFFLISHCLLLY